MNALFRLFVVAMILLLVSACQSLPPVGKADSSSIWLSDADYFSARLLQKQAKPTWRYSAKVGLKTAELTEQANLIWEYRDQANTVRLFGPLGVGAIKLQFDGYGVVLSDNRGLLHRGDNAEQLLTRIVGWPIPIDALSSWVFALPANDAVFKYQLDSNRQVAVLDQLGWRIEYSAYKDYGEGLMPRKIVATRVLPVSGLAEEPSFENASDLTTDRIVIKLITRDWK